MPRLTSHLTAAFAAIIITIVSVHAVTVVPQASASVLAAPVVA